MTTIREGDLALLMLHEGGMSYKEIAAEMKLSYDSVRGRVNRARRGRAEQALPIGNTADRRPEADDHRYKELTTRLSRLPRLARLLICSDQHMPDHDPRALALAVKLAKATQPDVIVLNGDTFDFSQIGRFPQHHSTVKKDVFRAVRGAYHAHIHELSSAAPGAAIIHLDGNHNARLGSYLAEHTDFQETLLDEYRALVRAGNRVLYLGEVQELELPGLLIQHGTRYGKNAAAHALEDLGGNYPMVQGHTHRPASLYKRIKARTPAGYHVVMSAVGGCLCNIPPAYTSHKTRQGAHQLQGVVLAHIDMRGGALTNLQNVVFHSRADGALVAIVGNEVLEVRA